MGIAFLTDKISRSACKLLQLQDLLAFTMKLVAVLVLGLALHGCLGEWVDICKDGFSSENECCHLNTADADGNAIDQGMEKHEYQLTYDTRSYSEQSVECRLKGIDDTSKGYHLVTFESRKEHDCVMKYIAQEHGDFGPFYLGLKADSGDYRKNLFEWDRPMSTSTAVDKETPTFYNWIPGSPAGLGDCVSVQVGKELVSNGQWINADCSTALPTICERYVKP